MPAAGLIDALLEISVVGSFSRVGHDLRRRMLHWRDPEPDALAGRTVAITGPTSGLGRAATLALADLGARLVLVGRSRDKLDALVEELEARHGPGRVSAVVGDLSSVASVRAVVDRISSTEPRLDVLIDNAGGMFRTRTESADGIEATLATMVVGPFVLLAGLLPMLRATGGARVIAVTSGGMYTQSLRLDDLQWRQGPWDGPRAYAAAKRAQTELMREWARRTRGNADAPSLDAMHPGWTDTPGLAEALPRFHRLMRPILRTPEQGVDTIVWLATVATPIPHGRLYLDRRPRPFDRVPATRTSPTDRLRLWDDVVSLAGIEDPLPA